MSDVNVKTKTYILNGKIGGSILVPVYDEDGKRQPRLDSYGRPMINKGGQPIMCMKRIVVQPFQTNVKLGTAGIIKTSDKYEQMHLDERVKQGESSIITYDMWKKKKNPQAFEVEQKLRQAQEKNAAMQKEIEKLTGSDVGKIKAIKDKDSETSKLRADIDKLKKKG